MSMLKTLSAVFLSIVIGSFSASAQAPEQWNSSKILHELNRFNTLGSVLYIAAHPDDENTRLISWLVGEKKMRTAYVSLTRGDGGQNLIGKEQGPLLGLIRTQELLAARRVDGAEQYFTRAYDFGYSKTPEETLAIWHQDSILADLVALIRQLQPDIIICRFPTTGEGGHGHHTASAILGQLAYSSAADPSFQVASGAAPWQASRLFWNTYSFGTINTTSEDQFWLDAGTFNPLLGMSYGEIASLSRSQHKSQGFGTAAQRGPVKEYFIQWAGKPVSNDIFEDLNFNWQLVPEAVKVDSLMNIAVRQFNVSDPSAILPYLLQVRKQLQFIRFTYHEHPEVIRWVPYKLQQLEQLIFQSAGIFLSTSIQHPSVVPGDSIAVRIDFIHQAKLPLQLVSGALEGVAISGFETTAANQLFSKTVKIKLQDDLPLTSPYWLENGVVNGRFQPTADVHGLSAELPYTPKVKVILLIGGDTFETTLPLQHRFVNPIDGELFQPVMVLPPVTLQWSESVRVFPGGNAAEVRLQVKAQTNSQKGKLRLLPPQGWSVEIKEGSEIFTLSQKGDVAEWLINISPDSKAVVSFLKVEALLEQGRVTQCLEIIDYAHLPRQSILREAELKLVPLQIKTTAQRVGYIAGAGDEVPAALKQLGYDIVDISASNYSTIPSLSLDAIITGVRAYNNHHWLNDAYPVLMKYIAEGGTLLVQYNTNNRIGPLVAKMSPYELEITRDRVTVEDAPVIFLYPEHPVLKHPNVITEQDFADWVQERGIYFAGKMAPEFTPLFSMNDPNETASQGGTVVAQYGKGKFVYTGLSFFRQLPAGIPGAYRLLVNLLE
jgi:LmbE family N-acetylglucosaminyl deacetylase